MDIMTLSKKSEGALHPATGKPAAEAASDAVESQAEIPRSRGRWTTPVILALLVIAGGGGWYVYRLAAEQTKAAQAWSGSEKNVGNGKASLGFLPSSGLGQQGGQPLLATPTQTVPVSIVQRSQTLPVTGTLLADEESSVASNASGIAAELRVDRGSVVRKDDVLVQIDPTDAQNKLAEGRALLEELKVRLGLDEHPEPFRPEEQPEVKLAKASLALANANLTRARELYAKRVVSTEQYDQARTEAELASHRYRQAMFQVRQSYQAYKTMTARLVILEKAVADTTIRAPFDGWVAEKLVAVGEHISSGAESTKVVTLVRIDPLRLAMTVPQQEIGAIQAGQIVRFHVDSFPDQVFTGKVRYIAPVVKSDTRSMIVEALVPNPAGVLRPGLFATAEIELPQQKTEMWVPAGAVQRMGEVARVCVVHDGVVREQVVALGEAKDQMIQIKSGLTGKELLVARPELTSDGDAVRQ